MYFVILFVLVWLWFYWKADKSRVRELYGGVVYTCLLGLLTDLIMVKYQLWSYNGLPHSVYTIPLTLDFGIYPVVSYLYLQNLPENWRAILKRALFWTAPAFLFECLIVQVGVMHHHKWWSLWLSLVSDILIYLSIAAVFRYYRPAFFDYQKR